jgi:sRNA-binding protein
MARCFFNSKKESKMSPVYPIRAERDDAIKILCEEYPSTFFIDPKKRVALKHGIEKEIEASLANNKNSRLLDYDVVDVVEWYRSHVGYKKACSIAGNGRVDLRGRVVAKVTEAAARVAEQETAEGFAEIEARKKRQTLPKFITRPPAPIRQARALPVDTNLNNTEMLAEVEKQLGLVRSILGVSSDDPLRAELARPALRLMIDELNTVIARLDEKREAAT